MGGGGRDDVFLSEGRINFCYFKMREKGKYNHNLISFSSLEPKNKNHGWYKLDPYNPAYFCGKNPFSVRQNAHIPALYSLQFSSASNYTHFPKFSPLLVFAPFQTDKHSNTIFPNSLPFYFAPPPFSRFKIIRSLQS